MTVRCPLCDHGADSDDDLVDHLITDHAGDPEPHREPKPRRTTAAQSPSPGADPAYVAQLVLWASEDDGLMVLRYVDRLIAERATPTLLAMSDAEFWPHARRTIRSYLEKGSQ